MQKLSEQSLSQKWQGKIKTTFLFFFEKCKAPKIHTGHAGKARFLYVLLSQQGKKCADLRASLCCGCRRTTTLLNTEKCMQEAWRFERRPSENKNMVCLCSALKWQSVTLSLNGQLRALHHCHCAKFNFVYKHRKLRWFFIKNGKFSRHNWVCKTGYKWQEFVCHKYL